MILDPELPICDAHQHLWQRDGAGYLREQLLADLASGHRVVSTVYVQSRSHYYPDGPAELRPVGETAWVAGLTGDGERPRFANAIVGFADLRLGAAVEPVIAAHVQAGQGRFRGIRHTAAWDLDPAVGPNSPVSEPRLLDQRAVRVAARVASRMDIALDVLVFSPQLPEVARFADAVPGARLILNHMGICLGAGGYAARREQTRAAWLRDLAEVARRPNVMVKIGGLGMTCLGPVVGTAGTGAAAAGPAHAEGAGRASAEEVAAAWRETVCRCIDLFGPGRCIMESNFPVDRRVCGYAELWNALKLITAGYSPSERAAMFHGNAERTYRIPAAGPDPVPASGPAGSPAGEPAAEPAGSPAAERRP